MVKRISSFIVLFLLMAQLVSFGQEISVEANNIPLNKLLVNIRNDHKIQISFDDQLLSQYTVTLNKTFKNPEEAIREIIRNLPLGFEKSGDVFIIYPVKKQKKEVQLHLSGKILDAVTLEPLPYSHIIINNFPHVTDLKGAYVFISKTDSIFSVKVSQLGYYILDTVVGYGAGKDFLLHPSVIGLKEVEILGQSIEHSTQIGNQAGMEKLNHKIATHLPGYGDNSVFNLLRLQPGILAAGEQTNELIIWGSYAGFSKVMFDGFTIYSLKNFNDNISAFNPLVAKDIEIYKGGFDTRFGDRVGGIVNITGKTGNQNKPAFEFSINNMTLNGLVELPVTRRSSLLLAVRHTWYNLYNPDDFNLRRNPQSSGDSSQPVTLSVVPDYVFRDMNLKYSAKIGRNDLFYISLYGGSDKFSYSVDEPLRYVKLLKDTREDNNQKAGSIFYGKTWAGGNTSNFMVSYSGLTAGFENDLRTERISNGHINPIKQETSENSLNELTISVDNRLAVAQNHTLETGLGFISNHSVLVEDTFQINRVTIDEKSRRSFLYFQDVISNQQSATFKLGFRLTHAQNIQKVYFEPRLSLSVNVDDRWKINSALGIYNQFIAKTSVVEEGGNYRYLWAVCNNEDIPVVSAGHFVLGTSYHFNGLTFSLEGFFKKTLGLTRYFYLPKADFEGVFEGKGKSYGFDLMLQKKYRRYEGWIAYTLSRTEELFDYQLKKNYRRAPQDQKHELKLAALADFNPFYFSANYVYGSGFPAGIFSWQGVEDDHPYSRLDVSAVYRFLDRKVVGEAGISILNLLNTENLKYENFERIPAIQTNTINIYSEAIPFTPALYLKITL